MSLQEKLQKSLEDMLVTAQIENSKHNIEAMVIEIDIHLNVLQSQVDELLMTKGALKERLRTIKLVDEKLLHHKAENPETTAAMQNLHHVNAIIDHNGC